MHTNMHFTHTHTRVWTHSCTYTEEKRKKHDLSDHQVLTVEFSTEISKARQMWESFKGRKTLPTFSSSSPPLPSSAPLPLPLFSWKRLSTKLWVVRFYHWKKKEETKCLYCCVRNSAPVCTDHTRPGQFHLREVYCRGAWSKAGGDRGEGGKERREQEGQEGLPSI